MSDNQNSQGAIQGYLASLPNWAKSMVALLTVPPLALAITGMLLNINVGAQLDKYMELYFTQQMKATEDSADRIIVAVDARIDQINDKIEHLANSISTVYTDLEQIEKRVVALEEWSCYHSATQGLRQDAPDFCE